LGADSSGGKTIWEERTREASFQAGGIGGDLWDEPEEDPGGGDQNYKRESVLGRRCFAVIGGGYLRKREGSPRNHRKMFNRKNIVGKTKKRCQMAWRRGSSLHILHCKE